MAVTPEGFKVMEAEIISVKGECSAGHVPGEKLNLSSWETGGLCGYFYHDIFPTLQVFQFQGKIPWVEGETLELECPDRHNLVTMVLNIPAE